MAGLLVVAGFCMLLKVRDRSSSRPKRFGFWRRKFGDGEYTVNLWLALPMTALTGFAAGAVGISGGSFKVPLMVLACGVPLLTAISPPVLIEGRMSTTACQLIMGQKLPE